MRHADCPPPAFPAPAARDLVRAVLDEAGFDEAGVLSRLGVPRMEDALIHRRTAACRRVATAGDPLAVLTRLFLFEAPLPRHAAEAALGAPGLEAFTSSGLATVREGELRPSARLTPVGERLVFASDPRSRHGPGARDFVTGPIGVSRELLRRVLPGEPRRVLDLGCGCGVLAIAAAEHARSVVATDVNARALAFTRCNAELNGAEDVAIREGNLFAPAEGERFDRILCNPPFVTSPDDVYTYRDGGSALCREIVRAAPAHLAADGCAQIMLEWPEREGADWREEVAAWIRGLPCDAWLMRHYSLPASDYADLWLLQEHGGTGSPDGARERWVRHLHARGAAAVGGGLLTLRRTESTSRIAAMRDVRSVGEGDVGHALADWIAAHTLVRDQGAGDGLLDVPLRAASGIERVDTSRPGAEGWERRRVRLRQREGLLLASDVDPLAAEIVGALAVHPRTAREALRDVTERVGAPPEGFLPDLPRAVAALLRLGMLVPAVRSPTRARGAARSS